MRNMSFFHKASPLEGREKTPCGELEWFVVDREPESEA